MDASALNLHTLKQIRHQVYQCCERSTDALFELTDALSSEATTRSLPELSLSPSSDANGQVSMRHVVNALKPCPFSFAFRSLRDITLSGHLPPFSDGYRKLIGTANSILYCLMLLLMLPPPMVVVTRKCQTLKKVH